MVAFVRQEGVLISLFGADRAGSVVTVLVASHWVLDFVHLPRRLAAVVRRAQGGAGPVAPIQDHRGGGGGIVRRVLPLQSSGRPDRFQSP